MITIIRGIELSGNGFDNLSISENNFENDLSKINLSNNEDLHDCYFNIEIPLFVEIQNKIKIIILNYETWNLKCKENSIFRSRYMLSSVIENKLYKCDNHDLFGAMNHLVNKLSANNIKTRSCYTCKLSLYHPYERPQMGELLCFKGIKNEFLKIEWNNVKHQFYQFNLEEKRTMYVTENYHCPEFE